MYPTVFPRTGLWPEIGTTQDLVHIPSFSAPNISTSPCLADKESMKVCKTPEYSQLFGNRNIAPEDEGRAFSHTFDHLYIRQEVGCSTAIHTHTKKTHTYTINRNLMAQGIDSANI